MASRWLLAAVALAAGAGAGCQTARPYLDPRGPVYRGGDAEPPAPRPGLRIVAFNIEYALRVERALLALREHARLRGADLLLLQEMDAPGTEAIARGLGLNYVYYPASFHPKHRRDVGNAILSPWPIEAAFKLPLPHRSRFLRQSRAATGAVVNVAGRRVRVYSVHLGSPLGASGAERRDQVEVVLCDARASPDPVVVGGDFNSHAIGRRLEADGYAWPTRAVGRTTRVFSYDHVFVKGLALDGWSAGVARDVTEASDHHPVWTEGGLPPPTATAPSAP